MLPLPLPIHPLASQHAQARQAAVDISLRMYLDNFLGVPSPSFPIGLSMFVSEHLSDYFVKVPSPSLPIGLSDDFVEVPSPSLPIGLSVFATASKSFG